MEPGDKWMIVTIIHLTEAPNPVVGSPTPRKPIIAPDYTFESLFQIDRGRGRGVRNPYLGEHPVNVLLTASNF